MNADEFEYYFELAELEPFAQVPPADLLRDLTRVEAVPPPPGQVHEQPPDKAAGDDRRRLDTAKSESPKQEATTAREHLAGTKNGDEAQRTLPEDGRRSKEQHSTDALGASRTGAQSASDQTAAPSLSRRSAIAAATNEFDSSARPSDGKLAAATAGGFSPWRDRMSVHVLGQFAFCNRAGIYSAENGDEADLDEPHPQWAYLPNFDLERIEEQLVKLVQQLGMSLGLVVIFIVGMVGGVTLQDRRIFYPALLGALVCLISLFNTIRMVLTLVWRRAAARRAVVAEPSLTLDSIEPANWWSLLKAGFEPVAYQRQFRHPRLPLEGSPWRVLERGSLRIPVIKSGADRIGDAKHEIYPKHELRLAAYAVLLEATEHVQVPYGLIFPSNSHRGLAIPITSALRTQVAETLQRASDLVTRSRQGESDPRPPQDRQRCASCRLGEPVPLEDAEISQARKKRLPLLVLADKLGRKYHCVCGDRFGSAPPHGRSLQLGLTSVVE